MANITAKDLNDRIDYLFKKINWADSPLDAEAVMIMNELKGWVRDLETKIFVVNRPFCNPDVVYVIADSKDEAKREVEKTYGVVDSVGIRLLTDKDPKCFK